MDDSRQPVPLQPEFVFEGMCQIDTYPYGKVSIFIKSEDQSIVNFSITMDIPLRAIYIAISSRHQGLLSRVACQAFNEEAIIPLLRTPI